MIRSLITALVFIVYILFVGVPLVLWSILVGNVKLLYPATMVGFRMVFRLAGIRLRVEGLENVPPEACIFASNHVSNLDPMAIAALAPRRISVLAKKELFKVPVVSKALLLGKVIPVDRSSRESAVSSVEKAIAYLRGGLSFLVFPEGTRSTDGRLREFRKGTFLMAIRAGVHIVPVSVAGSQHSQKKGEWQLHPGEITVRFGPAISARGCHLDAKDALIQEVHARVEAGLPEDQRPLAEE
jgi:1-acyl-sn-glycerol-3-phosphate acyltransferase